MKNIEEILQLLSWSNSAEDQERGRDMAQNIEDISELIQPDVGVNLHGITAQKFYAKKQMNNWNRIYVNCSSGFRISIGQGRC